MTREQIGTYTLNEPTEFISQSQWADYNVSTLVPAGVYPVMAEVRAGEVKDASIYISLPGTCNRTCRYRDAGQPEPKLLSPYAHSLALRLIEGREDRITLVPEFVPTPIDFTYNGKACRTYQIVESK